MAVNLARRLIVALSVFLVGMWTASAMPAEVAR